MSIIGKFQSNQHRLLVTGGDADNNITVSRGNSILDVNRFNSADSNKLVLFGSLTLDRNEFATIGASGKSAAVA